MAEHLVEAGRCLRILLDVGENECGSVGRGDTEADVGDLWEIVFVLGRRCLVRVGVFEAVTKGDSKSVG